MIKPLTRGSPGGRFAFASRLLALSVLASMIASLVVATPVLAADTATPATTVAASAPAEVAQANPFSDVPENSWAYDAVRQLAAEGLITGYPDNTFKGNRPMTRYEMAVLINRAVNAIQSKLAQNTGGVSQADLAAVRRLVDAFGPELQQVRQQLAALQRQTQANTSAISAIQAQNSDLQKQLAADEKTLAATAATVTAGSLHPKMFDHGTVFSQTATPGGPPAGFTYSAPGGASAAGVIAYPTSLTFGSGSQQAVSLIQNGHSINFADFRLDAGGAPDPRIQWAIRLESKMRWSGTTQSNDQFSESSANYATSVNGLATGIQDYGTLGSVLGAQYPVELSYGWMGYFSPGGFFAKLGRISQDEGQNTNGIMLGGGQVNGIQIGFKNANWYGYFFPNVQGNSVYNATVASTAVSGTTGLAAGSPGVNECPYGYQGNPAGYGTAAIAAKYGYAPIGAANVNPGVSTGPGINGNQCIGQSVVDLAGMLEFTIHSTRTAVGVTMDVTDNEPYTGWNPYAGLCAGATQNGLPKASVAGAGPTTTPGGGGTPAWNTAVAGVNGYCVNGQPLVYPATAGALAGLPVTGAYQTVQTNINDYGAYIVQYLGQHDTPQFKLVVEGIKRFGNDPFQTANPACWPNCTGSAWQDNGTLYTELAFASKGNLNPGPLYPATGLRNSNVVDLQYYAQGFNSMDIDGGFTGTGAWFTSQEYLGTDSGIRGFLAQADHWFTNNFRVGFQYVAQLNRYNLPAGSSTCPNCTLNGIVLHGYGLDFYFVM